MMFGKNEIMQRLCELEIQMDCYDELLDDLLKRVKKLEKPTKKVKK